MAFKSILVQLDLETPNEGRIAWVRDLAARLEARLIGLAAGEVRVSVHRGMSPMAASALLRQETEALEKRLAALGETFLATAGANASWRGMIGEADLLLAQHSRAADLVVPVSGQEGAMPDPGGLVLTAGRPVLLAAHPLRPLKAEIVVVAWKDTREARRAVVDALSILRIAGEVRLLSILEAQASAARESAADVTEFLRHHGVRARAELIEAEDGDVGAALSAYARAAGADLIVSGGFSRGPLRQRVFGGMTTSLLAEKGLHRLISY